MTVHFVYITTGSIEEALAIGKELVTSKLAASVNIIDNMRSIYHWEGELRNATEAVLIAKTMESRVPDLIDKVESLHSYDCPCIISLPVVSGNKSFLSWVEGEIK